VDRVTSLMLSVLESSLRWLFLVYATLVISHLLAQTFFADRTFRRSRRLAALADTDDGHLPSVAVLVPCYNEHPEALARCLEALEAQTYEGELTVYLVDDGSTNRESLAPVHERFGAKPGWHVVLSDRNRGKRHAHDRGFRLSESDIVVTIDSDTQVAADGIRAVVQAFRDERVGAATGCVGASNADRNLLTRVIALRYWIAFNQERAAQSWFRSVLCCSGAFAAYRRAALTGVWDRYLTQTYHGVPCTYGDDRHLTNLVLTQGYDVVYVPHAVSKTEIPDTLPRFVRQQLRWNKSFYREFLWTLPYIRTRPWYMTYEITCQIVVPFLYTLALGVGLLSALLIDVRYLVNYLVAVTVMAVARSAYPLWRTRDPRYALLVLYGLLHLAVLTPVRFRALATLTNGAWGTRGAERAATTA
jgi:cellulose synthase/poly-beta-1,6-N-acetylglucosamine synthase-like glycosyltransferase